MKTKNNDNFIQLDALRGIACIIVIIHQYYLAFLPHLKSNYPIGLQKKPLYIFLNGRASVIVFFVLSGFVLTVKYFNDNRQGSDLFKTTIKRFPRLYLPSALSVLLGYLVIVFTPHYFFYAGNITESSWLTTYAGSTRDLNGTITIADAIISSFHLFIEQDSNYLNTNLWPMKPELLGSFIVFFLVGLFLLAKQSTTLWFVISAAVCLWAIGDGQFYIVSFFIGMMLAFFYPFIKESAPSHAKYIIAILIIILLRKNNDYYSMAAATLIIYILISDNNVGSFFLETQEKY